MRDLSLLIMKNSDSIRLSVFALSLIVFILLEIKRPRRKLTQPKKIRWINNFSITAINTVLLKLILPVLAVDIAIKCMTLQFGVFYFIGLPLWTNTLLSVFVLDFIIYWQHRVFHRIPFLWRLHSVHHMDKDLDISSGARFHTFEMFLSMAIKMFVVMLLGVSPLAVILFEIALNACSMFNHSNFVISEKMDRFLQRFLVTPDMHRIHHSVVPNETDSNFGFCLSIWDKMFSSYNTRPYNEQTDIIIGLKEYDAEESTYLYKFLLSPFK